MATIYSAIQLQDKFTPVLNKVISAVDNTINAMDQMQAAMSMNMSVDMSALSQARDQVEQARISMERLENTVAETEQPVQRVKTGFSSWQKAIIVANSAVGLIKNTIGRLGIGDMSGAFNRMDTMSRFSKTASIMTGDTQMANAALQELKDNTLGTAYGLDVAAKSTQGFTTRGMDIGNAADQVRIWSDAVSFYGEGTNEQMQNVVDAVGKMYSKGTVEADQLDRLFDAGIGAAEMYAKAVGRSTSDVKKDLSDGKISSVDFIQTVSEALDKGVSHGAAKDAGGTWATTFSNMHAAFNRGWVSILQSVDASLAAHGMPSLMEMVSGFGQKVESVMSSAGGVINRVIDMAVKVGTTLGKAGAFVKDNWSMIAPILTGVITLLIAYNAVKLISAGITAVQSAAESIHATVVALGTAQTFGAAAAQTSLNAALLACPITWFVVGIVAVAVALNLVIGRYNKLQGTHISTVGAICGTFNIAIQFIKNALIGAANVFMAIKNAVVAMGQNIGTVFYNLGAELQEFWYGLLGTIVDVILGICNTINKIPFVDIDTSGLENAAGDYAASEYEANAGKAEYKDIGEEFTNGMLTFETDDVFSSDFVLDSYNSGYKFGEGLSNKVKGTLDDFTNFDFTKDQNVDKAKDFTSKLEKGKLGSNAAVTAKNTDKMSKSLAVTAENIKYLRDFATEKSINRYTSTTVRVEMHNQNTISSDQDIDGVVNRLKSRIQEEFDSSGEGAH